MGALFLSWLLALPCLLAFKLGQASGKKHERKLRAIEQEKLLAAGTPLEHTIGIIRRFQLAGFTISPVPMEPRFSRIGEIEVRPRHKWLCGPCNEKLYWLGEIVASTVPGIATRVIVISFCLKCGFATKAKVTDDGLHASEQGTETSLLHQTLPEQFNLHDFFDLMEETEKRLKASGNNDVCVDDVLEAIIATKHKALAPLQESAS